jgi:hypothetical protein
MKLELSDLLNESKADAPPPRYNVDDAVAAGRRLQGRRRVAWTGAGAAAAVVVVAAAIAVPQVLPNNKPGPTPAAAPAAKAPAKKAGPFVYPAAPFAGSIKGFRVGDLKVTDTMQVTPGYQIAEILGKEGDQRLVADDGSRHTFTLAPGLVMVYRKGVQDPKVFAKGEAVSVNGHAGRYITNYKILEYAQGTPALGWQYADGSWAVVAAAADRSLTKRQITAVAEGVASSAAKPQTVGFKLAYVPEGFKLAAAGTTDAQLTVSMKGESYLRLIKGDYPYKDLAGAFDNPVVGDKQLPMIQLALYPSWYGKYSPPSGQPKNSVFCASESLCYRASDDGKWQIEANGGGTLPDSELLKLLQQVTFANPADPASWYPATSAVS